jgi:hypothetical protein
MAVKHSSCGRHPSNVVAPPMLPMSRDSAPGQSARATGAKSDHAPSAIRTAPHQAIRSPRPARPPRWRRKQAWVGELSAPMDRGRDLPHGNLPLKPGWPLMERSAPKANVGRHARCGCWLPVRMNAWRQPAAPHFIQRSAAQNRTEITMGRPEFLSSADEGIESKASEMRVCWGSGSAGEPLAVMRQRCEPRRRSAPPRPVRAQVALAPPDATAAWPTSSTTAPAELERDPVARLLGDVFTPGQ